MAENTSDETLILHAPEFDIDKWIDAEGNATEPLQLSNFKGKFKIVYCFQYWCSACHNKGLPDLKKMFEALKEDPNIIFMAAQTVFEGFEENTIEKLRETQKKYELKIPFGHDAGDDGKSTSNIMKNYGTGGTPWFLFIDKHDNVVFSDFHLNPDAAIQFLKSLGQ